VSGDIFLLGPRKEQLKSREIEQPQSGIWAVDQAMLSQNGLKDIKNGLSRERLMRGSWSWIDGWEMG
jgi:hypothetical protein